MTAKQILLAHIIDRHRGISGARSMTHDQLRKAHANTHFRFSPDHYHQAEGEINLGPDQRPAGWYTGLDVVENAQGYLHLAPASTWDKDEYDRVRSAAKGWDDERLNLYLRQFTGDVVNGTTTMHPEAKAAILREIANRIEAEA